MKEGLINKTIEYLDQHRHGALATIREDGTPQASTVSYVSKGLDIYFMTDPGSQKAKNMAFNPNVAFAISDDFLDWDRIVAVQLAGKAAWVEDKDELSQAQALFAQKFPQIKKYLDPHGVTIADIPFLRITPKIINYLDYSKGFNHWDSIEV